MQTRKLALLIIVALSTLTACDQVTGSGAEETQLQASGVVEAVQVEIAAELPGRVVEVFVNEGDPVAAGDPLFRLDGSDLEAQRAQVEASLTTAQSGLTLAHTQLASAVAGRDAAEIQVEAAQLQLRQVVQAARLEETPARLAAWTLPVPEPFNLPGWYFQKPEQLEAARAEVEDSAQALEEARADLESVTTRVNGEDLAEAEARLARARARFLIAQDLLDREIASDEEASIDQAVQNLYDAALDELESAQLAYDQLLSDEEFDDLLEARADLAVAEERHALALNALTALLTGEQSPAVQTARLAVAQAEAAVRVAETAVAQAEAGVALAESTVAEVQAAIEVIDVQMARLTVHAPVSGVVLVRNVQPGEMASPGMPVLTIGQLEPLTLTVYIPEDRYGQVHLGDTAMVTADSFPGRSFEAVVTRIADQAEFTPRNVQTQEERVTTVYAVELQVHDLDGDLKPGMPVDVQFGP